jgi:NMT1/THI5 like
VGRYAFAGAFNAQNRAAPLLAVYVSFDETPLAVIARRAANIRRPADLDGKKIAGGPGTAAHDTISILLKAANVLNVKINWAAVQPQLFGPMLRRGEVDGTGGFTNSSEKFFQFHHRVVFRLCIRLKASRHRLQARLQIVLTGHSNLPVSELGRVHHASMSKNDFGMEKLGIDKHCAGRVTAETSKLSEQSKIVESKLRPGSVLTFVSDPRQQDAAGHDPGYDRSARVLS